MFRFKLIAGLVSLVLLAGLVLTVVASAPAPVEAGGDIETEFNLVDNPKFTPNIGPVGAEPHGSGEFELDGDTLEFELDIDAEDLVAGELYRLTVTVRNVTGGDFGAAGDLPPSLIVTVGTATADDEGRLEFEGEGVFPADAFDTGTEWRIDQQVRLDGSPGGTLPGSCVECILVCAPTTKVRLGGLVQIP